MVPLHRWSSFQVFWACAQCFLIEKNSNLCFYFSLPTSSIANLTQQQAERRRSHDRVHTKRAHLVSFHFSSSMFFLFLPIHSAYWMLRQVLDVESEYQISEICKFIGTSPKNISRLTISLVCSTSRILHIWFTQQLALLFKPFCQFAWVVQKHSDQWRPHKCGSFGVRFALFSVYGTNFGIALGKQLYSQKSLFLSFNRAI